MKTDSLTRRQHLFICVILFCTVLLVYSRVWQFGFLTFDDDEYFTANTNVSSGLSMSNMRWAFTTSCAANYHPLTWISLQLDASVFGFRPGYFHAENALLHAFNAVLLYIFLKRAAGQMWPAAFVAAIFAAHPSHVESVAWIAERKDVLSTFLLLLAMICYLRYARGIRGSYAWMLLCFALSLLTKQMGVTLPIVLLLLDYWPLNRTGQTRNKIIVEKIPLLLLSVAASAATFIAQRSGGAVVSAHALSASVRVQGAVVGYVRYLYEFFWPVDLCVFYPYRRDWSGGAVLGSALLLGMITLFCVLNRRRQPWLIVGWLWFGVTLLPVIGLIQVGSASIADRYLYLPSVGLTIAVAWGVQHWMARRRLGLNVQIVRILAAAVMIVLAIAAYQQTRYWDNTRDLLRHAVLVNNDAVDDHMQLAKLDLDEHNPAGTFEEYKIAAALAPMDFTPEYDMGNLLMDNPQLAVIHYVRAAHLEPKNPRVENNLGVAYLRMGRFEMAMPAFHAAIAADPAFAEPHINLGKWYESAGDSANAVAEFRSALKFSPENQQARDALHALESH